MKLVITDDRNRSPSPDPRLIATIAQGRRWFAEGRGGKACSITELAERHGIDHMTKEIVPVPFENPIRSRNPRVWPKRGKVGACVMPYDFCP